MDYDLSNYLNGDLDLLAGNYYTKTEMNTTYMTYQEFVATALIAGATIGGLVGITLIRAVAEIIRIALEKKRGSLRDNTDNLGNYTGTIPTFRVAMTSLAAEAGITPSAFIENDYPLAADGDYNNYVYGDYLFPRTVSFHFLNWPRGLQGDTENRDDRRRPRQEDDGGGGDGAPPPATPGAPRVPGGVPTNPWGIPPVPKQPPKDPSVPGSSSWADWYQRSNLFQRKAKTGLISGRAYKVGDIPALKL